MEIISRRLGLPPTIRLPAYKVHLMEVVRFPSYYKASCLLGSSCGDHLKKVFYLLGSSHGDHLNEVSRLVS